MISEPRRHVILITGSMPQSKSIAAIMSAMRMMNGIPMLVSDHHIRFNGLEDAEAMRIHAAADFAKVDGIILMGSEMDIDPKDYHESFRHPKTVSERDCSEGRVRACYEYALVELALKEKKPLFAVCGGMQRLNVFLCGSLHQHVPDLIGTHYHHQGSIAPFIPVQYVAVVPGTKLAAIGKEIGGIFTPQHDDLPPGIFMENSFHHQAVDRVAEGLIPSAFSIEPDHPDLHIVQAIESDPEGPYKDQFILGVQWHPEFGASDLSMRTLQNFTSVTQAYAREHPRNVSAEEVVAITAGSLMGGTRDMPKISIDWNKTISTAMGKKPGGKRR